MLRQTLMSFLKIGLGFLVGSVFLACGVPNDKVARKDFYEIAKRELPSQVDAIVTSSFRAEGDSENFYQHVKFDVVANENITSKSAWLDKTTVAKGVRRTHGEAILLYQRNDKGRWVVTKYWLQKSPQ